MDSSPSTISCVCVCAFVYTHARTHTHTHTHVIYMVYFTCIHTRIHACIYTYAHTYIHTHTHTYLSVEDHIICGQIDKGRDTALHGSLQRRTRPLHIHTLAFAIEHVGAAHSPAGDMENRIRTEVSHGREQGLSILNIACLVELTTAPTVRGKCRQ